MESSRSISDAPLHVQQQIDACVQEFADGWTNGRSPRLEDFVRRVDAKWRGNLLCELIEIELACRLAPNSRPLSDSQICDLHPELMPELGDQLQKLRSAAEKEPKNEYFRRPVRPLGTVTEPYHSPPRESRGLHIRCPHCSNPVELLSDTPHDSITCRTCGSAFNLADEDGHTAEAPTLRKIGRFELISRLGIGGFGTVWKARDTELDRAVAIKIPRRGKLTPEELESFIREARMAAQLRHANIVSVHEVGRESDTLFIVSDLVRGVSLSDWLSGETPSFKAIANIVATIAEALNHAHQEKIIHRDIKPSNILIDESGKPILVDFGLAKRLRGEITMTVDGQILGTPAYMSPEQAGGNSRWIDSRTDIYSLGVVLFRMLTGELPFRGNSQMQIHNRLTKDPPDPRTLNRFIPLDLSTICLKCMEQDPNRRYATAKELADELQRFIRNEPIHSRPVSRIERTLRWGKRNPALATAIALTVVLAVAGPIAAVVFKHQETRLAARDEENNNLIKRYKNDIQQSAGQISELRDQLDVWEGRANPWTFWPPKRNESPRQSLISTVLDHSTATLAKPLRNGKYDHQQSASGYLGLAILAEAAGKDADARDHYQRARAELEVFRQQNLDMPEISRAVAECDMRLARLSYSAAPDKANEDLQSARAIYRQLAAAHGSDPAYQIDWLESEFISAIGTSPQFRAEHLDRVEEINRALEGKWPNAPIDIYRLACYLTEEDLPLALSQPVPATSGERKDRATTAE